MSHQAQTWFDEVGIDLCETSGEAFVLFRVAGHTGRDMRGCWASAKTLARETKMGESTVLKHLRALRKRGVLLPGDPQVVSHIRPDKRPPVYDLPGGHEDGCSGCHAFDVECGPDHVKRYEAAQKKRGAGRRSEHPKTTGARSEHPQTSPRSAGARFEHPQENPSSAGARSEHPQFRAPVTGAQIDLARVLKSSTKRNKELKLLLSNPAGALPELPSQVTLRSEREIAARNDDKPAEAAPSAPQTAASTPAADLPVASGQNSDQTGGEPDALQGEDMDRPADGAAVVAAAYAAAYKAHLGLNPRTVTLARVKADAAELLAAGRSVEWLSTLAGQLPERGWSSLIAHAEKNPEPKRARVKPKNPCPQHPGREAAACRPCQLEAEPDTVDLSEGAAFREALRNRSLGSFLGLPSVPASDLDAKSAEEVRNRSAANLKTLQTR